MNDACATHSHPMNEPCGRRDDGPLLTFLTTFIAVPVYLFVRMLARIVPEPRPAPVVAVGETPPSFDKHHRSARMVAWFVTNYRRSALHTFLHRKGPACRFIPCCAEYPVLAVEKHGLWRGLALIGARFRRCTPDYVGDYLDFP
jgi:putative component of membrane protein insertase Oxa1/YidC/SpoIIIJ protein YidD